MKKPKPLIACYASEKNVSDTLISEALFSMTEVERERFINQVIQDLIEVKNHGKAACQKRIETK